MARLRNLLIVLIGFSFLISTAPARAGLIGTDEAQAGGMDQERARVKSALVRPEVARELEKFGISAKDSVQRVDAMTDTEVRLLAGRIDALPAGGAISNTDLIIIILIVILIALVI
jgi:hypothetical protein